MSTLFSIGFITLFVAFIVAAIIGHALVIQALIRPFAGKPALAKTRTTASGTLLPHPTR